MKKLSVFIVSSLLLFVFSAKAMAAEETLENNSGLVTGQITDAEKQILPGASIIVEGMHAGVTSDINGFYTIFSFYNIILISNTVFFNNISY